MKTIFTFSCIVGINFLSAQTAPGIEWQNTIGGGLYDYLYSAQQTSGLAYILGGYSNSAISGDKTEASLDFSYDYWVVKIDMVGNILWQNTIGGNSFDLLRSVGVTSDGGYILGGSSNSGISGDKTEANLGDYDYWVVKLDYTGEIEWQNTIGGNNFDDLISIEQTSDGGYILGGYSSSGISGDKTEANLGPSSTHDYWIVKLDGSGNIEWQNTIGGSGDDELGSLHETFGEGYILGGSSKSGISGDKTKANRGDYDYWVMLLSTEGSILWQNTIGGNSVDVPYSVQEASLGYIIGGYSNSGITGDKTEASLGLTDYWVVKLDIEGDIEWQNTIGGSSYDYLHSVQQTVDGGYILGGDSESGVSGDKTEASFGSYDYWVVKLHDNGDIDWENTIGGNDEDHLLSIRQQIGDQSFILGGYSYSGISGDKTEASIGSDYWVIKLVPDCAVITGIMPSGPTEFCKPASVTLNAPADVSYTYQWIRNDINIPGAIASSFEAAKTGNYSVQISNGTCSSVSDEVTVISNPKPNATITNVDTTNNICYDTSIKLKSNGGTGYSWQWYKGATAISGATSPAYYATASGNYKVRVTNGSGCSKMSAPYPIINSCRLSSEPFVLNIYPNPASDIINIEMQTSLISNLNIHIYLNIYDITGQLIKSETANSDGATLNIKSLSAGIYLFELIADGMETQIEKVIIE